MKPTVRAWCARAKFPDTKGRTYRPFIFGTVFAETELAADDALRERWRNICPYDVEWLAIIPGAIVFVGEEDVEPMPGIPKKRRAA